MFRSAALGALHTSVLILTSASTVTAATSNGGVTTQLASEGWIALFDGASLFGWQAESNANWHVASGTLQATGGDPGLLRTTAEFADFELHVEFRSEQKTNSGVFLRTTAEPQDPTTDCYEINIADRGTNPFPTGSIVGRLKAKVSPATHAWQVMRVRAEGPRIQVWIDGQAVANYHDPRPKLRGAIGLQKNQGRIEFRNVRLRPVGMQSLFNGRDLAGWREDGRGATRATVTEQGALRIQGGKGQLETEATYDDFLLQTEIFVNGEELNSGIFFRCIPGDTWMGYESQIHNGMRDGDPRQPSNGGTGGIFRRQTARRIVASDFTWFHQMIVANGPHLNVWVNGFQVSSWTDERAPHQNPRQGLRTAAGTILVQGHDPETDISLRNIQIQRLPVAPRSP